MSITKRAPQESYNFAGRTVIGHDDTDYAGTTRNATHVDFDEMPGLTRGIVRADRPRTWQARGTN